jgi:hypothetical protein
MLRKKIVNPFMTPILHTKHPFSHRRIIMVRDKGTRSAEASGIEIYTNIIFSR